jgi:hypothetical protein
VGAATATADRCLAAPATLHTARGDHQQNISDSRNCDSSHIPRPTVPTRGIPPSPIRNREFRTITKPLPPSGTCRSIRTRWSIQRMRSVRVPRPVIPAGRVRYRRLAAAGDRRLGRAFCDPRTGPVKAWRALRSLVMALFTVRPSRRPNKRSSPSGYRLSDGGPEADAPIDAVGSYRFDDPDGRVGMETHLVDAGGMLLQVPLTYRDEPLADAEQPLITQMQHSLLGTRWVYDGLRDPKLVVMLAAVAMTGQGEAIGMAVYEGRWYIAPTNVRIHGGGWTLERVAVDGFEFESDEAAKSVLRNDRFELIVFRRPAPGTRSTIGLTASWDGRADPVVLAEVHERPR